MRHCIIKKVTLSDDLKNLADLLSQASQWRIEYLELTKKLCGADLATMSTLVKTGHVGRLEIAYEVDMAEVGEYLIEVAEYVDTLQIKDTLSCKTEEDDASVGRLLRSCPVVKVSMLCLSSGNDCHDISVNKDSLNIGVFNIWHTYLLPTWLLDYPDCSTNVVSVCARLSAAAWHQVACLLSHCRVEELHVWETDCLKTAGREDIETLWRCVQGRWWVRKQGAWDTIVNKEQRLALAGINSVSSIHGPSNHDPNDPTHLERATANSSFFQSQFNFVQLQTLGTRSVFVRFQKFKILQNHV